DELTWKAVDDVRLATLQHGKPGRRLRYRDHGEFLGVDGPIVALEGFELDLHPRLDRGQLVGSSANRPALKAVWTNLLVILCWHDPTSSRHVARTQQQQEIEEWFLEAEADGARVDDVHGLGLHLEGGRERAAIVLVAEFDVLGRDGLAVVKLDAFA